MKRLTFLLVATLAACQQQLGPDAQAILDQAEAEQQGEAPLVRLANFERLPMGAPYEDVAAELGSAGTEVARTQVGNDRFVTYRWAGSPRGEASLTFNNEVLVQKVQTGLM